MIQNCSKINVYDKSGANIVRCFKKLKYKNNTKLNALLKVSVQTLKSHRKLITKKGTISDALLIKTKYSKPRFNGQKITFATNGCILIQPIKFKNKKTRTKLTLTGSTVTTIVKKEFRLYSIKIKLKTSKII